MSSRSKRLVKLAVAMKCSDTDEMPVVLAENLDRQQTSDTADIREMVIEQNVIIEDQTMEFFVPDDTPILYNIAEDDGGTIENTLVQDLISTGPEKPVHIVDSEANHLPKDVEHQSESDYQPSDNEEISSETLENQQEDIAELPADANEVAINVNEGRKRRLKANAIEWVRNKNKKLRMQGQQYLGIKKNESEKRKQNVVKPQRELKPRCSSNACEKATNRHCFEIIEQTRIQIFNKFWKTMNWDQRRVFVSSNLKKTVKTRQTVEGPSRRQGSYIYTLNDLQVCRKMFLNTLCIGYKTLHSWVDQSFCGMHAEKESRVDTKQRVKEQHKAQYEILETFFNQLPKLPAHYCRKDSLKLYLEPHFQSLNDVYKLYLTYTEDNSVPNLARKSFSKVFHAKNLSVYSPKKDQCNTCVSFKCGNISEERHAQHQKRKEEARIEKSKDKVLSQEKNCITITMDVQAVNLSPYLNAGKIYFKTKLCCHNFTVFNLATKDVVCYWWSEDQNNQLVASTFTSCILDYLQSCLTDKKIPIIIWSDGCPSQNRNNVLSNALLNFAVLNQIEVFQKYLEPGHTQMECDSVHSTIERKLRNREIHLPSDYVSVSKESRVTPFPYRVKLLEFDFFKNYSLSKDLRYQSIRPGKMAKDHVINDIRVIRYLPNGQIQVKLSFEEEYIDLPSRPKKFDPILDYPPLLTGPCKIKEDKWKNLQELKYVIPKDTHYFYDNLLH